MKLLFSTSCLKDSSCKETRTLCMGLLHNTDQLSWNEKAALLFFLAFPEATLLDFIASSSRKDEGVMIATILVAKGYIEPSEDEHKKLFALCQLMMGGEPGGGPINSPFGF